MTPMSYRRALPVATLVVALSGLIAACSSGAPTWTYEPAERTAEPSASAEGSPAASGDPASPDPSASGSGALESPEASAEASADPASPDPSASTSPEGAVANTEYTFVGRQPCPESRFECVTLSVPKDHFAEPGGETWDVAFAIQRASGEKKGTFVIITGGPGGSGVSEAETWADYFATGITNSYDLVFTDQRGVGLSHPIQCYDAAAAYYSSPARVQETAERDAATAAAQTFATDCIAEAGVGEADLPFFSSQQAIHDLESIRDYLGVDQMQLYGVSYGTQFVQQYAAEYPERIASLMVDGAVDLTVTGPDYYVEATRGADDTLVESLDACTADETCRADIKGGDALAVYDALADRLAISPITFDYPTADGTPVQRQLTAADLETAAFAQLYSPFDRSMFLRAIAAASDENYVPLAQLAYGGIGVNPDTLVAEEDPTWSDAMYYAVECQDYAFYPDAGDPAARTDAWVAQADEAGLDDLRLETSFYGDLPCIYWPTARAAEDRPEPLVEVPYPVFVMSTTTDPATPIANAMRIYSRLDDAYFFQTVGGPHGIFDWGEPCPDDAITAFLAEGTRPKTRIVTCDGSVTDTYIPTAETAASEYDDALALMTAVDDQILYSDAYQNRFDDEALTVGCDFGGTATYTPTDTGSTVTLTSCEVLPDLPMSGEGTVDDDAGTFALDVTSGADELEYERDADGNTSVTGTYGGDDVDLTAAA